MKYYLLPLFVIFILLYIQLNGQTRIYQTGYGTSYDDEGYALCEGDSNSHVVVGFTKGYNGGTNKDTYIVKFDKDGRVKWSNHFDDGDNETGVGILRYINGDYFVMSIKLNPENLLLSRITGDGNILWTRAISSPPTTILSGSEMILLPNGNLAFCGLQKKNVGSIIDSTGVIIITDTSGAVLFYKNYDLGNGTSFNDMIITIDNQLAICGISSSPGKSILLVKADFNGDTIWSKKYLSNYQYLLVSSLLQYPSGIYVIGGAQTTIYSNSFLHATTSSGDSVLFHKTNTMLSDEVYDIKYTIFNKYIFGADIYFNFKPHFGYLTSDSLGNILNSIVECYNINAYAYDYATMVTGAREIVLKENGFNSPIITLVGGQRFSGHGLMDVGLVQTEGSGNYHTFGKINISAKTNTIICPGDSVLITVDSNSYSTFHWINAGWPGTDDLGTYNDSIWVRDSGYYHLIGMDSDSGIVISNKVVVDVFDTLPPVITYTGYLNFCYASGQTLRLQIIAKLGSQYQWYNSGTLIIGATGYFLDVSASGIYTCKRINPCGEFESFPVTVNAQWGNIPYFTINSTGSYNTWCNQSPAPELILYPPWGGPYHYQWFYNNVAIPNSDATSITINGAGDYYCIASNGCGTTSSNITFVQSAPQPSIMGSNSICASGDSVILIYYTNNLVVNSYQWYFNGSLISGATNNSFVAYQPGSYYCQLYTNSCLNSPVQTSPFVLSMGPVNFPPINLYCSDTLICENEITILSANQSTYIMKWFKDNVFISSSYGNINVVSEPGTYFVMTSNICDSSISNTITIHQSTVQALNLGTDTIICNSDSLLLDAGVGYSNYLWNTGDTVQSIYTFSSTVVIDTIESFVTITDSFGCTNFDSILVIFDICLDESSKEFNFISVYPNPFSVYTKIILSKITKNSHIEIYNSIGELILIKNIDNDTFVLDTPLTPGVYFCVVQTNQDFYRFKLVSQKADY